MNSDVISKLRDIHDPAGVSWWPPAPGWWLLMLIAVVLVMVIVWLVRRLRRDPAVIRATKLLGGYYSDYQRSGDSNGFAREVSELLRRVCLAYFPRKLVASMTGVRWLEFLDQGLEDKPFSQGDGRCLATAPYDRDQQVDAENLYALVRRKLEQIVEMNR